MWRVLRYFVLLGLAIAAAWWLAENPGQAHVAWGGYQIDPPLGLLVLLVLALGGIMAFGYQLWTGLRHVPDVLDRSRRERRLRQSCEALSKGMVAVAAGNAGEAAHLARRAQDLLEEPSMTLLLSAQAAQLNGDEQAAAELFREMTDLPGLELLGVRGLYDQAMARGDKQEALTLASRARQLQPTADWAIDGVFDLQVALGQWDAAEETVKEGTRQKRIDKGLARQRHAVLLTQQAEEAEAKGDVADALRMLAQAGELYPDLYTAVIRQARLLVKDGKQRKAAALIERVWASQPHPDLVEIYLAARTPADALNKLRILQGLAERNPRHVESAIAVAAAALEAQLWGEARRYLEGVVGDDPPARVCRLMVELEEAQHGDMAKVRSWLSLAATGECDPAWVCDSCGHVQGSWTARCDKCGTFDGLRWRPPPRVAAPAPHVAAPETLPVPVTGGGAPAAS